MKSLNEDLKTGNFKQIYLLYGEEGYLKKQYKERFVKAMVAEGDTMNYAYSVPPHDRLQNRRRLILAQVPSLHFLILSVNQKTNKLLQRMPLQAQEIMSIPFSFLYVPFKNNDDIKI